MQNHSEIAEFLWKIADLVKDDYEAKDYEDVILPFTLLRRLDCVLEKSRDAVRRAAEKYKKTPEQTRDALLKRADGQQFYNTSEYENVPLKEDIDEYFRREVLPHVPDSWMDRGKDKVGYEISFTKYFYEYTPLRSTAEIAAELLKLDEETENLLREIAKG